MKDDFAKLSQASVEEQEKLQERIAELEQEVEAGKEVAAAGAALDTKKKIEAV